MEDLLEAQAKAHDTRTRFHLLSTALDAPAFNFQLDPIRDAICSLMLSSNGALKSPSSEALRRRIKIAGTSSNSSKAGKSFTPIEDASVIKYSDSIVRLVVFALQLVDDENADLRNGILDVSLVAAAG
ncbi:hypothetical protein HDU98_009514, partial [Podochytrium sp. JEL0797]